MAVAGLLSGDSGLELMVGAIHRPLPDDAPIIGSSGHFMTTRDCIIVFTVIVILQ